MTGAGGGVGLHAVQLGAMLGAAVMAVDLGQSKLTIARELGADIAIDPTETDLGRAIREWTDGRGADGVLELVGPPELDARKNTGSLGPLEGLELLAPAEPTKIVCVGRNYAAHAVEMGHDPDKEPPFFFQKNPDNLDPSGEFPYPPKTSDVHHEGEIAVREEQELRGLELLDLDGVTVALLVVPLGGDGVDLFPGDGVEPAGIGDQWRPSRCPFTHDHSGRRIRGRQRSSALQAGGPVSSRRQAGGTVHRRLAVGRYAT